MSATDQTRYRRIENPYTRRWRFQFSIVTLLGLTALVAAGTWLTTVTPSALNGLIVLGVGVWFPLLVVGFHRLLIRGVSEAPQCEGPYLFNQLAEALDRYGLALLATGDSDGAALAFAESRAINERLGLPVALPP